jgi:1,4-alpha-glucan branching enzyme
LAAARSAVACRCAPSDRRSQSALSCHAGAQRDSEGDGFTWIDANNGAESVFSYLRDADEPGRSLSSSPISRPSGGGCRIGVPHPGRYLQRINTDAQNYGGSGIGNFGGGYVAVAARTARIRTQKNTRV